MQSLKSFILPCRETCPRSYQDEGEEEKQFPCGIDIAHGFSPCEETVQEIKRDIRTAFPRVRDVHMSPSYISASIYITGKKDASWPQDWRNVGEICNGRVRFFRR